MLDLGSGIWGRDLGAAWSGWSNSSSCGRCGEGSDPTNWFGFGQSHERKQLTEVTSAMVMEGRRLGPSVVCVPWVVNVASVYLWVAPGWGLGWGRERGAAGSGLTPISLHEANAMYLSGDANSRSAAKLRAVQRQIPILILLAYRLGISKCHECGQRAGEKTAPHTPPPCPAAHPISTH